MAFHGLHALVDAKGKATELPYRRSRAGIVAVGVLSEGLKPIPASKPDTYVDGSKIWWRYRARVAIRVTDGFVPRAKVNGILGYKQNYNLRGFGDHHSGLKKLSVKQYEKLLVAFGGSASRVV